MKVPHKQVYDGIEYGMSERAMKWLLAQPDVTGTAPQDVLLCIIEAFQVHIPLMKWPDLANTPPDEYTLSSLIISAFTVNGQKIICFAHSQDEDIRHLEIPDSPHRHQGTIKRGP